MSVPAQVSPCACGRDRSALVAPTVEMEVDAAGLRLDGVALLRCDAGHAAPADGALAQHLVAAIDAGLLVASRRRLRRGDACGDCGTALTLPARRTDTPVPFATAYGVVTPTVIAPMVRCPACGREQLVPEARAAIPALADACVDAVGR